MEENDVLLNKNITLVLRIREFTREIGCTVPENYTQS